MQQNKQLHQVPHDVSPIPFGYPNYKTDACGYYSSNLIT